MRYKHLLTVGGFLIVLLSWLNHLFHLSSRIYLRRRRGHRLQCKYGWPHYTYLVEWWMHWHCVLYRPESTVTAQPVCSVHSATTVSPHSPVLSSARTVRMPTKRGWLCVRPARLARNVWWRAPALSTVMLDITVYSVTTYAMWVQRVDNSQC